MKINSIDDLKGTKIYLSNRDDRKVFQDICFGLGIRWWFNTGKTAPQHILDHPFFIINESLGLGAMTESCGSKMFDQDGDNIRQIFLHDVVKFDNDRKQRSKSTGNNRFGKENLRRGMAIKTHCDFMYVIVEYYSGEQFAAVNISHPHKEKIKLSEFDDELNHKNKFFSVKKVYHATSIHSESKAYNHNQYSGYMEIWDRDSGEPMTYSIDDKLNLNIKNEETGLLIRIPKYI